MAAPFKKVIPFVKEDVENDQGIIKGYGSTFGGKPDSYGDIIAPGAFSESIKNNGRGGLGFAMLWQHNSSDPMGIWEEVSENKKGLLVKGPVEIGTDIGLHRFNLIKMGAVKGLSIGFDMPRDKDGKVDSDSYEINEKNRTRLLKTIDLWEISPVTFAANTRANITGAKGLKEAKTEREIERILRDSGLSRSDSVYLASLCKFGLRDSGTDNEVKEILKTLDRVSEDMKTNPVNDILETLNFVNSTL